MDPLLHKKTNTQDSGRQIKEDMAILAYSVGFNCLPIVMPIHFLFPVMLMESSLSFHKGPPSPLLSSVLLWSVV